MHFITCITHSNMQDLYLAGKDLPEFPVDGGILPEIKKIVKAARDYEKLLHQDRKRQSEKNWFNKMASEADLIIGDEHR